MQENQEITVIRTRKPADANINVLIRWIGESLGLFNSRDKDSSCYRIFIELIKSSRAGKALSSDELAYIANLSRGTVVHHVNKLMTYGLVVRVSSKYRLRQNTLSDLVDDLAKDADRMFSDIQTVAQQIDENLYADRKGGKEH